MKEWHFPDGGCTYFSHGKSDILECRDCSWKCRIVDLPEYSREPRLFWKEHALQCPKCLEISVSSEEGRRAEPCECGGVMLKPKHLQCPKCSSSQLVSEVRKDAL